MLMFQRNKNDGIFSDQLGGWIYVLEVSQGQVLLGFDFENQIIKNKDAMILSPAIHYDSDNDDFSRWLKLLQAQGQSPSDVIAGYSKDLRVLWCDELDHVCIGGDIKIWVLEITESISEEDSSVEIHIDAPKNTDFVADDAIELQLELSS